MVYLIYKAWWDDDSNGNYSILQMVQWDGSVFREEKARRRLLPGYQMESFEGQIILPGGRE